MHLTVLYCLNLATNGMYRVIYKENMIPEYTQTMFLSPFVLGVIFLLNISYVFLYYNKIPYFESLKSNNLPWPWEQDLKKFKKILPDMIFTYMKNQFILVPIYMSVALRLFSPRYDLESLPGFFEFWFMTWMCFIIEDFWFYWIHRLIHHPKLYWIHKKHHKMFNTFHLACVYTHWIEFIVGVCFPLFAGMMVFQDKIHIANVVGATAFRVIETHESHGGYEFEYSLFQIFPSMVDTSYHNYHHLKNIGNYGTYWTIWDTIFGTNQVYFDTVEIEYQFKYFKENSNFKIFF